MDYVRKKKKVHAFGKAYKYHFPSSYLLHKRGGKLKKALFIFIILIIFSISVGAISEKSTSRFANANQSIDLFRGIQRTTSSGETNQVTPNTIKKSFSSGKMPGTYTNTGRFRGVATVETVPAFRHTTGNNNLAGNRWGNGRFELGMIKGPIGKQCSIGCYVDAKCVSVGDRNAGSYCSLEGVFKKQLTRDKQCENSYECLSNACEEGECAGTNLLDRFANWVRGSS
jgi:hypothetical protein